MKSYRIFALALMTGALLTACGGSLLETETTSVQLPESDLEKPVIEESELLQLETFQPGETEPEEVDDFSGDQPRVLWPDGEVKGLCARGGFEIDMKWSNGKLSSVKILSKLGNECKLKYQDKSRSIMIDKGEFVKLNKNLK